MIRSARCARSASYASQPRAGKLVLKMPASGPGAQISCVSSSCPRGERMSTAIERLPLFSPAQNRLCPSARDGPAAVVQAAADRVEADDVGAELGQRHAAQRRGDERRAFDDAQSLEDARPCRRRPASDHALLAQLAISAASRPSSSRSTSSVCSPKLRSQAADAARRFRQVRHGRRHDDRLAGLRVRPPPPGCGGRGTAGRRRCRRCCSAGRPACRWRSSAPALPRA